MQLVERAKAAAQSISADDIDFKRYLHREERKRIVPAGALAEIGKDRMCLAPTAEPGLTMPWAKTRDKVKVAPGKLVIWTGWSRHGKSQMLKQLMLHAMACSEKVTLASMEEEIIEVWCEMGRMALDDDDPSLRDIEQWITFSRDKLWFYDQQGMVEAAKLKAVMRYCAEELKVTHFVIDSLMMLAIDREDYDSQSRLVNELKRLAADTQCTVHLVAHMRKREGRTGEEKPGSLHDIAGGHEIGSMADYVFNVWRNLQERGPQNLNPDCILGVEKQRGRVNWLGSLGLNYHQRSRQFIEGDCAMRFW